MEEGGTWRQSKKAICQESRWMRRSEYREDERSVELRKSMTERAEERNAAKSDSQRRGAWDSGEADIEEKVTGGEIVWIENLWRLIE
jgi:hypothetical protein